MTKGCGATGKMRNRGIDPNVISYNAAISAREKGNQWQRALEKCLSGVGFGGGKHDFRCLHSDEESSWGRYEENTSTYMIC